MSHKQYWFWYIIYGHLPWYSILSKFICSVAISKQLESYHCEDVDDNYKDDS